MFNNLIWIIYLFSPDLISICLTKLRWHLSSSILFIISASSRLSQLFAAKYLINLPHPPIWTTRFIICECFVTFGQLYLSLDTLGRFKNNTRFPYLKRILAATATSLALDPIWYRSGTISQLQGAVFVAYFGVFIFIVSS